MLFFLSAFLCPSFLFCVSLIGLYHTVAHTLKLGFLAPVFKKEASEGNPAQYLYSHHHEGRLWLLGQSYTTWSIRLDLVSDYKVKTKGCVIPIRNIPFYVLLG